MPEIQIVTVPAERRQIARVLSFDAKLAPYINWDAIALTAIELGANIDARYTDKGACNITLFWRYDEKEGTE